MSACPSIKHQKHTRSQCLPGMFGQDCLAGQFVFRPLGPNWYLPRPLNLEEIKRRQKHAAVTAVGMRSSVRSLGRLRPREKWLPFGPIIFISQPSICDQEGSERETFPILCGSTHLFAWVYFAEGTRGGAEFFSLMVFLLALEQAGRSIVHKSVSKFSD